MNKRKNIIITLLVILLIGSFTMTYLALNGTISLDQENEKEDKEDKELTTPNKPDESKFIRKSTINLEETSCKNREIKASIDSGNIVISYNDKKVTINTKNAKYLYKTSYQVCTNVNLFYITEDGKLYMINGLNEIIISSEVKNNENLEITDIDSLRFKDANFVKLSSKTDNIKEFLGNYTTPDNEVDEYGYIYSEIIILDENNKERNITYHKDIFR